WALAGSGGWMERDFDNVGDHPNEHVRAWAVRLVGDDDSVSEVTHATLTRMSRAERSHVVAAQLACSARRLTPAQEIALVDALLDNPLLSDDPQLPLLVWWAQEDANRRDTTDTVRFTYPGGVNRKLADFFNERVARRLLSGNIARGRERIGTLFSLTNSANDDIAPVLRGIATALQAHPLDAVPPALRQPLAELRRQRPKDLVVLEVLARMKDAPARAKLRELVTDESIGEGNRLRAINLLRDVRDPRSEELFLDQLAAQKSDALRVGLIGGLEAFEDVSVGEKVLGGYSGYPAAVKKRAVQMLTTRPAWALLLLKQIDSGKFPKADVSVDQARAITALGDKDATALVEKHFGRLALSTTGEKQARIAWLNTALGRAKPGDPARGKILFTKHCAACHQLHGEGGKVGPD
ncbi:MAG: c-type cytochrome, partial [Gemmataceae bacterium]|nr:c-type cytochrome [Gemmataceae bacterium]